MKHASSMVVVAALLGMVTALPLQGQILKKVKEKAKEVVREKVECVTTDEDCIAQAKEEGKDVVLTDEDGKPVQAAKPAAKREPAGQEPGQKAAPNPGEGAWANYDFVPGEKVLFREDFASERVGNFPRRLEMLEGNAEVVKWNGGTWLRVTTDPTAFAVPLPQVLPGRFTIEFQVTMPWWGMEIFGGPPDDVANQEHSHIILGCCEAGISAPGGARGSRTDPREHFQLGDEGIDGHLFNVRVQGDGKYVKVYLEEKRLGNLPSADFVRSNKIYFHVRPSEEKPVMIGNISINAGGTEMYQAIMQNGRFATQGILFDVDSDRIRPESTPTLNQIADMMKEHADLKILVEGHTDATGDAAHNQTLSDRRAAAVKTYLTSKGGIDATRLSSKGFGSSKPMGTNDTAEGRQANRRVELVKQ